MKKLFIALTLALTLGFAPGAQAQHHRHNPTEVGVQAKADTTAMTAYSDTTNAAAGAADSTYYDDDSDNADNLIHDFSDVDDPFILLAYLGTLGAGGVLIAIFCVIFVLLVFALPFIIIGMIIYWITRNKKKDYQLAEKAIENGQPIPDSLLHKRPKDNEAVWQRGIKNTAIGVGIMIFGFIVADFFIAVGAIVACWGIGQCVIARTSASGRKPSDDDDFYGDIPQDNDTSDKA